MTCDFFFFFLYPGYYSGEENGNPLQHSCLENPMDRGAWQATVHGVTRVGHNLVTKLQLDTLAIMLGDYLFRLTIQTNFVS